MRKHFVFVCTLAIAAAFFSAASSAQAVVDTSGVDATQGGRYVNNGGMDPSRQDISGALANASGCLFTSNLGELLSSLITYLAAQVLGEDTTEAAAQLMKVPTDDSRTSETLKNIRAKDVCAWAPFGFCIIPSLDAMAFCFVNQVIDYIGQATVEWIKTGFKGSPAFIDDPEKFFTNAVDSVAGQLLNQISDGLLCSPWRAQIQLKLLNEHVGSFQNSAGGCRLSEVSDRWEQFAESGQAFSWDLQYAYTQNPYNNSRRHSSGSIFIISANLSRVIPSSPSVLMSSKRGTQPIDPSRASACPWHRPTIHSNTRMFSPKPGQ